MALTKVVDAMTSGVSVVGHTHAISDVTSLQAGLDGKSATGHTHVIANVTDAADLVLTTFSAVSTTLDNWTAATPVLSIPIVPTNHNLGVVPTCVRCVLECVTTNLGYAAGDEVDLSNISTTGTNNVNFASWWANSTQVGVVIWANATTLRVIHKTTPTTAAAITTANWRIKIYARR